MVATIFPEIEVATYCSDIRSTFYNKHYYVEHKPILNVMCTVKIIYTIFHM